jgi:C-terminal processing protease CtpA/Prc
MSVRNGNVPDPYKYAQPAPEFYASLGTAYLPESNGRMSLKADDPRLQLVAPRDKAFTGKVYVICDGLTTDAAAAFVMMAKRSHRAKIVGEETGSNATSYCGGQDLHVTLPRTECVLHMPLMRYVPDGEVTGSPARGEMPDHKVVQSPEGLALGRDMVRTSMIELIDEMR